MKSPARSAPGVTLLLMAACARGPSELDDPTEIVQRAVNALGGIEGWRALRDVTLRESRTSYESGRPEAGRRRLIYIKRSTRGEYKIRMEEEDAGGPRLLVFDGRDAWGQSGDRVFSGPEASMGRMPLRWQTLSTLYFFSVPFKLLDPGIQLRLEGKESVEGNPCYVVGVSFGQGVGDHPEHRYLYFIDQRDFRIHKYRFTQFSLEPHTRDNYLDDWRQVGPVVRHLRQVQRTVDGKLLADRRWEILAVNGRLDDTLFEKPKTLKPKT